MIINTNTYTVESVTSGHPDKVCDQVSDAILDECLRQDPKSRVAIESFGSHDLFVIGGEITTKAAISASKIAKKVYQDIGYNNSLKFIENIITQSPDIAMGVDDGGAGDQGIMYGYATSETKEFLPKAVVMAHKLSSGLEKLRKSKKIKWLMPDGKTQVTVIDGEIRAIIVSCQHKENISQEEIHSTLLNKLIDPICPNVEVLVNPTGRFIQGGFEADTGLTGRKIMVDTYGGLIPHGGGCFSGKDPSKVDRSAAYMARYVAKRIVAGGLTNECLISVAYAIGKEEPLMINAVNEKGDNISDYVRKRYDFRPLAIIERLNLQNPIYLKTASYGHFGKSNFPWENLN